MEAPKAPTQRQNFDLLAWLQKYNVEIVRSGNYQGNKDNLDQQIDRIALSLGIPQGYAEDHPPPTPLDDLLLGVPAETWLGLGVLATVGIVHCF